jgi:hypothetical protein
MYYISEELEILSEFQDRLCTLTRANISFTAVTIIK